MTIREEWEAEGMQIGMQKGRQGGNCLEGVQARCAAKYAASC